MAIDLTTFITDSGKTEDCWRASQGEGFLIVFLRIRIACIGKVISLEEYFQFKWGIAKSDAGHLDTGPVGNLLEGAMDLGEFLSRLLTGHAIQVEKSDDVNGGLLSEYLDKGNLRGFDHGAGRDRCRLGGIPGGATSGGEKQAGWEGQPACYIAY